MRTCVRKCARSLSAAELDFKRVSSSGVPQPGFAILSETRFVCQHFFTLSKVFTFFSKRRVRCAQRACAIWRLRAATHRACFAAAALARMTACAFSRSAIALGSDRSAPFFLSVTGARNPISAIVDDYLGSRYSAKATVTPPNDW